MVFDSDYCKDVSPEQGLVNYIFRGSYTQGLDSEFYMVNRTAGTSHVPHVFGSIQSGRARMEYDREVYSVGTAVSDAH